MRPNLSKAKTVVKNKASNLSNPLFRVMVVGGYRPSPSVGRCLGDKQGVKHAIATDNFASRPKQGLWWCVSSSNLKFKATMRTWCKKRMRAAIVDAFRKQGYDAHGMPLAAEEGTTHPQRARGPVGTLVVFCAEPALTASAEETRVAGELVVKQAMERAGVD